MKNKILFLLSFVLFSTTFNLFAQEKTVSGIVKDAENIPMIGVNVVIKGTTNGTTTNLDGEFSLNVPGDGTVLQFSFIGYQEHEVTVIGDKEIQVTLLEDAEELEEVVVTALGIDRKKDAIGYSVESVSGETMSSGNNVSPLEGLTGKVSGLNVQTTGGGPGGSTKMIIRGANSLTGSNEPLYVIDGMPLDNSTSISSDGGGGFDYGNAANNINPDDIENISVLKGGAAAALYGSRGQNGVIMITTKKGKKDKLSVNLKSGITFSDVMITPDFQNDYAQGSGNNYLRNDYQSWGPKMTGQTVTNFLGQEQVLTTNTENPYDSYFKTGVNFDNTVTVSKAYEGGSFYTSLNYLTSDGIVPNEEFDKLNLNLRVEQKLNDWIKIDTKANIISQSAKNRPNLLNSPDNPVYGLYHVPRSVSMSQLEQYQTITGLPVVYTNDYVINDQGQVVFAGDDFVFGQAPLVQNPYWTTNLNTNEDDRKRFIGFAKVDFDFLKLTDWNLNTLNLMVRAGTDYYVDDRRKQAHQNTVYKPGGIAELNVYRGYTQESNYDFLLSGSKLYNKFGVSASIGGNIRNNTTKATNGYSGSGLINPYGKYVLNNFNNVQSTESIAYRTTQSLYGMVTFDYNNTFYLDISGRNDWSSTLSPSNWSFFYPSASFSWVLSQSFQLPEAVDYVKLRTSWAKVGGDVSPGSIHYSYTNNSNQYFGLPYGGIPYIMPNTNILPEMTESIELGLEADFLNRRLHMDLAYYETGTKNQIFNAPVAPSSGFTQAQINAGYIKNQGIELALRGDVIKNENFTWSLNANISRNYANVEELAEGVDVLTLSTVGGVQIQARPGYAPGVIVGTAYERDENGNVMLDDQNLPIVKTKDDGSIDDQVVLGNSLPKWIAGFGTTFQYKNFVADIFFDSKFGHDMYSYTNAYGNQIGALEATVDGRDAWAQAVEIGNATGTNPNTIGGKEVHGVREGSAGVYYANPQAYYNREMEIDEANVYDASYIRLQKVSFGYIFRKPFKGAESIRLSVYGNNLFYLYSNVPNVSPNSAFVSGSFGGVEMFSYPETRNFGFQVNYEF